MKVYYKIAEDLGLKNEWHLEMFTHIITNDQQLRYFMNNYYTGQTLQNLLQYKRDLIHQADISSKVFLKMFQKNKVAAVQELLKRPVKADKHLINNMSDKDATTLYERFLSNYNLPIDDLIKPKKENRFNPQVLL